MIQMGILHIAIRLPADWAPKGLIQSINNWNTGSGKSGKPVTHPDNLLADTSADALKKKITDRLASDPTERWIIFSGHTIAEIQFRGI